jgi:hypothetical protein
MILFVIVLVPVLHGCSASTLSRDPSIVIDMGAPSPKVENGTAYDKALLDLGGTNKVILPTEATIRRGGVAGRVQLLVAKQLGFAGHPGEPTSFREARKHLGCAVRSEGAALLVAIHGEWDSGIECRARVKHIAVVPDGVEVDRTTHQFSLTPTSTATLNFIDIDRAYSHEFPTTSIDQSQLYHRHTVQGNGQWLTRPGL